MKIHKSLYFLLLSLFAITTAAAQTGEISPQRKQAIDSLALEKVRDLSSISVSSVIRVRHTPRPAGSWIVQRNCFRLTARWAFHP
jgi:hypothetical protein